MEGLVLKCMEEVVLKDTEKLIETRKCQDRPSAHVVAVVEDLSLFRSLRKEKNMMGVLEVLKTHVESMLWDLRLYLCS
jgi:ABC-type lipopolysaccharide export system ATPase subunit